MVRQFGSPLIVLDETLSSNYNTLGRPAVVLVQEGEANLIIRSETYQELLRNHLIPKRLEKQAAFSLVSMG